MTLRNACMMAALAIASAAPAFAQTPLSCEESKSAKREAGVSATNDAQTGGVGSAVVVDTGSDASSVSVAVSFKRDRCTDEQVGADAFSVKISSPLNKATQSGTFVTDTGITNGTSLEVAYAVTNSRRTNMPAGRAEALRQGRQTCRDKRQAEVEKAACDRLTLTGVAEFLTDENRKALDDPFYQEPIWMFGISGSIGHQTYKHRDLTTFAEQSSTKTPISASVFMGVSPNDNPTYFGGGYQYRVEYKDSQSRILCQPPATGQPQECFNSPFAAPNENTDSAFYVFGRALGVLPLPIDSIPFGIELKLAYDTEDDILGASLPIYVLPDKAGGLRGGLKIGWQDDDDDDDDVTVGVFVSTGFKLFGN